MTHPHNKILSFLYVLDSASNVMRQVYTEGGCYRLYELLNLAFPEGRAKPFLHKVDFHVATRLYGRLYDITGEITDVAGYEPMDYVDVLRAESVSCCYIEPASVRSATWPSRSEMLRELEQEHGIPDMTE